MLTRRLLVTLAAASLSACVRDAPPTPQPDPPVTPVTNSSQAAPASTAMPAPPEGEKTDATCARFANVPVPAADQPTAAEKAALAKCDGEALFYGIGQPVDFAAARKCAYVERDNGTPMMGGAGILLMVYGGGKGVAPNLDLAIRFACEAGHAPAEVSGRVERFAKAKREGRASVAIDFCEDITSGLMAGHCSKHEERMKTVLREARKQAAVKGLPTAAVEKLDKAGAAYFSASSMKEVDLSGTMRAALSIAAEAALADDHVATLEKLANPSFSPPSVDAAKTEKALQASYDKLMKCRKAAPYPGGVDAAGIKDTEKLWLPYREAWLELVTAARPSAPKDQWQAFFSAKRTKMLDDIGCP